MLLLVYKKITYTATRKGPTRDKLEEKIPKESKRAKKGDEGTKGTYKVQQGRPRGAKTKRPKGTQGTKKLIRVGGSRFSGPGGRGTRKTEGMQTRYHGSQLWGRNQKTRT